jgi:hypothetical protein
MIVSDGVRTTGLWEGNVSEAAEGGEDVLGGN